MNILQIDASTRYQDSISRGLSRELSQVLTREGGAVVERDLNQNMHFVSEASLAAVARAPEERNAEQQKLAAFADSLIDELQNADALVLGLPMYNFGPPSSFKAWADLVARAGTTFRYTSNGPVGLLTGKKAYLVAVSGGTPIGGAMDFMTPWVKFFLGFIGITDVELISADSTMGAEGKQNINAAYDKIAKQSA